MKLLALDTATDACSVAAWENGLVHERFEIAPRRHAQLLLAMLDAILAQAGWGLGDLDAIAFGRGPGSFTGVRIAAATAQGLAVGSDRPLVPVSSLAALAQAAFDLHDARRCAAAFDARMEEVYYGAFEIRSGGVAEAVVGEQVCPPEEVTLPPGGAWAGVGPGWDAYSERLTTRLGERLSEVYPAVLPRARDVAALAAVAFGRGEAVSAEAALPVYLRDRVTQR